MFLAIEAGKTWTWGMVQDMGNRLDISTRFMDHDVYVCLRVIFLVFGGLGIWSLFISYQVHLHGVTSGRGFGIEILP